jgi:hypothetical protein
VDRGLTPDNYTYRSLISVLCLVLGASKAKEFVNDLENSCAVLQL